VNRKRIVRWSAVGVAVVALGAYVEVGEWIPGPKPTHPSGSWLVVDEDHSSIEPDYGEISVYSVRRDSAKFEIYLGHSNWESASVRVGETATLAGVTITLCDTWVNRWAYIGEGWSGETGGVITNGSRAYYVQSHDGTTPVCP